MAQKIVKFEEYCKKCKHKDKSESEDPCWDCLILPVNEDSYKPTEYEEAENQEKEL